MTATIPVLAAVLLAAGAGTTPGRLAEPYRLSPEVAPGETFMGIRLLGTLALARRDPSGTPVTGLSALAWDEDEAILYALSDQGRLLHLRPRIEDDRLRDVELLASHRLTGADGRPLRGRHADSEGLVALDADNGRRGDTRLLVSFEHVPRVVEYTPTGQRLRQHPLPAPFGRADAYATPNHALESIGWHPTFGLLAAPEWPMPGGAGDRVPIFSADGQAWEYTLYSTPNASLVAIEVLPDGSLVTLERGYGLLLFPIVVTIRRTPVLVPGRRLEPTTLAVLDSSQGFAVDNFEGLTRQRGMRFFMVSDDNGKSYQRTLLAWFEVVGAPGEDPETASGGNLNPVAKAKSEIQYTGGRRGAGLR